MYLAMKIIITSKIMYIKHVKLKPHKPHAAHNEYFCGPALTCESEAVLKTAVRGVS